MVEILNYSVMDLLLDVIIMHHLVIIEINLIYLFHLIVFIIIIAIVVIFIIFIIVCIFYYFYLMYDELNLMITLVMNLNYYLEHN